MPRKFLGHKLDKDVDMLRPPSLTLTAEDICKLPPVPTSSSEESLILESNDTDHIKQKKLKRLSKQYGGTIYFKKRLESVPEIFLHDFKKRQSVIATKSHIPNDLINMERLPIINEKLPIHRTKSIHHSNTNKRVMQRELRHVSQGVPYKYAQHSNGRPMNKLHRVQPQKVTFQQACVPYPIEKSNNDPYLKHTGCSRSTNEILFDEILDAYGGDKDETESIPSIEDRDEEAIVPYQSNNSVLNSEIERVLEHVQKQQNIVEMNKRISPVNNHSEASSIDSTHNTSSRKHLSELMSSNDESIDSGSDTWSELDNTDIVTSSSSNTEGYETAQETIPSSLDIVDLNIHDMPSNTNELEPLIPKHTIKLMPCHKTMIVPQIFVFDYDESDDETHEEVEIYTHDLKLGKMTAFKHINKKDIIQGRIPSHETNDDISDLQSKIDRISLDDSDIPKSISSSIYS